MDAKIRKSRILSFGNVILLLRCFNSQRLMAENWRTPWIKGTGQESEITPIFENLHISSLAEARKSNGEYHSVNMCDNSNHQENEHQFPVGEIVSMYGVYDSSLSLQKKLWTDGVKKTVELLKRKVPLLVHCHAGIHRSTLVSSAALTLTYPNEFPDLDSAHEFVLTKRIIGWKKEDTFRLMESIVDELRTF